MDRTDRAPAWCAGLLVSALLAAYLNGLRGVFQFDDYNVIVFNPVVHSLQAWWADLGSGIRPLLKLTYAIQWTIAPDSALSFHVFNIGVHVAAAGLVFLLARQLARSHGAAPDGPLPLAALAAALVFGLHPAHTEAVTYISGRSSSLMALFYLAGFLSYVAGTLDGRRWLAVLVAPLCFVLAVATKETAVTFPLALLLWEWSRPGSLEIGSIVRRQAASWAVLLVVAAILWRHPIYGVRLVPDLTPDALHRSLLTQVDALTHLVRRLVVVYPLNIDPDLRVVTAWTWAGALRALFLASLAGLGVVALRRRPWWGFGILWFFLQLAPTNSLLPRLDLANDRHLYLASAGLCTALGVELQRWLGPGAGARRWVRWPLVAWIIACAALTALRNHDYSSEIRLWEQTARVSPHKPRVFNNLGFAYGAAGCLEQAEAAYREALRLNPRYELALENLAALRERSRMETNVRCGEG